MSSDRQSPSLWNSSWKSPRALTDKLAAYLPQPFVLSAPPSDAPTPAQEQSKQLEDSEVQVVEHNKKTDNFSSEFERRLAQQQELAQLQQKAIEELEREIQQQEETITFQKEITNHLLMQQRAIVDRLRRQRTLSLLVLPTQSQYIDGDGETFVWMLNDFEAKRSRNAELFSPEFYSTKFSYTFRLKVRMNGSGSTNEGCMSCGVNFRPGQGDDSAKWPVDLVYTLSIIDCLGGLVESASIDTLKQTEDTVEVAFQRPDGNNELSRGWGNFITWAEHNLSDLIVNDTMQLQLHMHRSRPQ
eukprot:c9_g1_i1.p1 GENE.c9_g1_i1~~c9_g1_i1.p1  ORF type:complete len:300 (-),score=69.13 c9_g1_i1:871-1770(-)